MHNSLSQNIEQYILGRLADEQENFISLRRKELAEMFECVPSQINYVLRSRFTPEHGYIIDSRRGEHGYIKIMRIMCITPEARAKHIEEIIGNSITLKDAHKLLEKLETRELVTQRERLLIEISLRHCDDMTKDIGDTLRERIFADLLTRMLKGLMLKGSADLLEGDD